MPRKGTQDLVDLFENAFSGEEEIPDSDRMLFDQDHFEGEETLEGTNEGKAIGDYIGGRIVKTLKPEKLKVVKPETL